MSRLRPILIIFAILVLTELRAQYAGSYNIDQNDSLSSRTFESFNEAVDSLVLYGVSGSVTLNVVPNSGPYNEQLTIPYINGVSAQNTVTIDGHGELITYKPANSDWVIRLWRCKYLNIDSLRIEVSDSITGGSCFTLCDSVYNTNITNCHLKANTSPSSLNSAGIRTLSYVMASPNHGYITIENNEIVGGGIGISMAGADFDVLIKNNVISNFGSRGIYINTMGQTSIIGNDISRSEVVTTNDFIGIDVGSFCVNAKVLGNRIHNSHGGYSSNYTDAYGIRCQHTFTWVTDPVRIANNLIYNLNTREAAFGIHIYDVDNMRIHYNTIVIDGQCDYTADVHGAFMEIGQSTNVEFKNNLISLSRSGQSNKYGINIIQDTSYVRTDYNNIHVLPGSGSGQQRYVGLYNFTNRTTLLNWQSTGHDAHSISVSPDFIGLPVGDLTPTDSAANNKGLPIAGLSTDFFNTSRSSTHPDQGAIEFDPVYDDAGIIALNRSALYCSGQNVLKATIENLGYHSLDSLYVIYSINGLIEDTLKKYTSISRNDSVTIEIDTITNPYNADLKVWTYLPNGNADRIPLNDTIEIHIGYGMYGTYTVDTTMPLSARNFHTIMDFVDAMDTLGICDSVVCDIKAGTGPYNEDIILPEIRGASLTNTITFLGNGDTLRPKEWDFAYVIWIKGGDYYRLDHFVLRGWGNTYASTLIKMSHGANHNIVKNCHLIHEQNTWGVGISMEGSVGDPLFNGNASFNKILNNTIENGNESIVIKGIPFGTRNEFNVLRNNTLKYAGDRCLILWDVDDHLVEYNDFISGKNNHIVGLKMILTSQSGDRNVIRNNRIHDVRYPGSASHELEAFVLNMNAVSGQENLVYNNVVYHMEDMLTFKGLLYTGSGLKFYNNTICATSPNSGFQKYTGLEIGSTATNFSLLNNNVFLDFPGTYSIALKINSGAGNFVSDFNNYFISGDSNTYHNLVQDGTTLYKTLNDWQVYTSKDKHSVSVDPLFLDSAFGDYSPSAFLLNKRAKPIAFVDVDIEDSLRHLYPDIGAYEFSAQGYDVSLDKILMDSLICTGFNPLSIQLTNFSSKKVDSVRVIWSKDGFNVDTAIVHNLEVDSTYEIALDTIEFIRMSLIKVWIELLNDSDQYLRNDTQNIIINTKLIGDYTLDRLYFSTARNYQSFQDFATDLETRGVCGPVRLTIAPNSGPYYEQVAFGKTRFGDSTNSVKIKGNLEILQPPNTNNDTKSAIMLNGTDYLSIDSLEIQLPSGNVKSWGIRLSDTANFNSITNCIIDHGTYNQGFGHHGGIVVTSSTLFAGNGLASDNLFEGNTFIGGDYAVVINGSGQYSPSSNNIVRNNTMINTGQHGIYLKNTWNTLVSNNDISRRNAYSKSFNGIILKEYNRYVDIHSNTIWNIFGAPTSDSIIGIFCNQTLGLSAGPINIYNNLIDSLNGSSIKTGIRVTNSSFVKVKNNSVIIHQSGTKNADAFLVTGNNIGVAIENNLAKMSNEGSGSVYGLNYLLPFGYTVSSNFNAVDVENHSTGYAFFGRHSNINYQNLSQWQSISSGLYDQNSSDASSFLTYAGEFPSPRNNYLNALCPTNTLYSSDLLDSARGSANYDPGAIEFQPFHYNSGAISIDHAAFDVCGDSSQILRAVLVNYGDSVLHNIPVGIEVFDGASLSYYLDTLPILAPKDTDSIVVGRLNANLGGIFAFRAFCADSLDAYPLNDTSEVFVNKFFYRPLPFSLGDTTVCIGQNFDIILPLDPLSNYQWFYDSASTVRFHTGDQYSFKGIQTDTSYYIRKMGDTVLCYSDKMPYRVFTQSISASMNITKTGNGQYEFTYSVSGPEFGRRWYFDDNKSSFDSVATHTYTKSVKYPVALEVYAPCDTLYLYDTLDVFIVGLDEHQETGISVYPIPSQGLLFVEFEEHASNISISVQNMQGQNVGAFSSEGTERMEIQLPEPAGIYFLHINADGLTTIVKVLRTD